jgi:hypothetical protein
MYPAAPAHRFGDGQGLLRMPCLLRGSNPEGRNCYAALRLAMRFERKVSKYGFSIPEMGKNKIPGRIINISVIDV